MAVLLFKGRQGWMGSQGARKFTASFNLHSAFNDGESKNLMRKNVELGF